MDRINSLFRDASKKAPGVTVEAVPEIKGHPWKPMTLRRPFLLTILAITLGLIALIQVLVIKDRQNDGLLFAPDIGELGTFDTFLHRYLPTIVAVLYSIAWTWVDLDTKRIEPYRQLSKPGGATGRDSLLLHYPYDFLGFVPFTSFKRKHWPVFTSSCALILVAWGVTPLQGAIFATDNVMKSIVEPMQLAQHHLSIADQAAEVTANYTYSASNIAWLGERLPAFMTREAAFMAFKPQTADQLQTEETWTARTTSFSADITCEEAAVNVTSRVIESSQGCQVPMSFGPDGEDVIGDDNVSGDYKIKEFSAFFAGNQNHDGLVDYYISSYCPEKVTNVFMVAFARNKRAAADPPATVTRLFCQPEYVQKDVVATVRSSDGFVQDVRVVAPPAPLPPGLFNTSLYEWQMNTATQQNAVRGKIPTDEWPNQDSHLSQLDLTMPPTWVKSSRVIGLAIGTYTRPLEEYLEKEVLTELFRRLHKLLFARALADVLSVDFKDAENIDGTRTYTTQAIRVVPGFAYAVEGLLGLVTLLAVILLGLNWGNTLHLQADPESVMALMALTSGQNALLNQFSLHDQSSSRLLERDVSHSTYALSDSCDMQCSKLDLLDEPDDQSDTKQGSDLDGDCAVGYPSELSRVAGICLVLALASALAAIAYLYNKGRKEGLSLPSQDRFVRQMLENYVPTIVATILEPVWILLNRILCTLQPFDGLRSGGSSSQRSISLNYTSLPPQLAILKALRARHFTLAAVCALALLTNVLAVAFSGMFNERTIAMTRPVFSGANYTSQFQDNLENSTHSDADPFYAAMANFTSATPMPAWTDDDAFYLPVTVPAGLNESDHFQVQTTSLKMDLVCSSLERSWDYTFPPLNDGYLGNISGTLSHPSGPLSCISGDLLSPRKTDSTTCSDQAMALEIITQLTAGDEATQEVRDQCKQMIVGVWARQRGNQMCAEDQPLVLTDADATAMFCKPTLFFRSANVTVTGDGTVVAAESSNHNGTGDSTSDWTVAENSGQVTTEALRSLLQGKLSGMELITTYKYGGTWHNDSYPSDWFSYVMENLDLTSGILDPKLPRPDFESTAALLSRAWRKTTAIWLSSNHERLLQPMSSRSTDLVGTITYQEVRIMVSRSMVILSLTILALYIVVAFAVYGRQPARFLPRMPITIASDLALFAASKAVAEGCSASNQGHTASSALHETKFGYGNFVGTDGKLHVGIEKSPFVTPLRRLIP